MTKDQQIAALTERVAELEQRMAGMTRRPTAAQVKAMVEVEYEARRAVDDALGRIPQRYNGVIR